MIAKLGDFSEISKLTNVKNHIGRDIFHLFGLFRLSQTLRRLGMVKQCGHSASEVIQAMCMFKVLGETICSMYSPKFNNLLAVGKNCFYRMPKSFEFDNPHKQWADKRWETLAC